MNEIIKEQAKETGVKLWELAAKYGISDGNFSRKLRFEFTPEETERALRFINEIAAEKNGGEV